MTPRDGEQAGPGGRPDRAHITDPRAMRAVAHPLRLALLEAIRREGTLTATRAGEMLDESPGNVSWHLKILARYGFIEEAEGGRGRTRPWRATRSGEIFDVDEDGDQDSQAAGEALETITHQRNFDRLREWVGRRHLYAPAWRRAAFSSSLTVYVNAEELAQLSEAILALVDAYSDRARDPARRPPDAQPVRVVAFAHPVPPTPSGN